MKPKIAFPSCRDTFTSLDLICMKYILRIVIIKDIEEKPLETKIDCFVIDSAIYPEHLVLSYYRNPSYMYRIYRSQSTTSIVWSVKDGLYRRMHVYGYMFSLYRSITHGFDILIKAVEVLWLGRKTVKIGLLIVTKDKQAADVHIVISPKKGADGNYVSFSVSFMDLDYECKFQTPIPDSKTLLSEYFSSWVKSDEFRAIITSVMSIFANNMTYMVYLRENDNIAGMLAQKIGLTG